jgi:cellulose synthase (UDP-forming)
VGLAEDLITAIRLHAAGWRSVYVPEIVSRGLVPEDLTSFFEQQLKWSRGVYEVVFAEMPRLFPRLTWRQRLSYGTIGTYYLCGVTMPVYLAVPYLYLWTAVQPASMPFGGFLTAAAPVAAAGVASYLFAERWLCDAASERGLHWRGLALKLAAWPIYLRGTVLAILRRDVPYVPTSKRAVGGRFVRLAWPQLALLSLFAITMMRVFSTRLLTPDASLTYTAEAVWGMTAFASAPVLAGLVALYAAWQSDQPEAGDPWDAVDPDRIGGAG